MFVSSKAKNVFNGSFRITKIYKGLQKIYHAFLYKIASGDELVLTDSLNDSVRSLKIYGDSTQNTIPGNQLCNFPDVEEVVYYGVTYSCKDGVITLNGTSSSIFNTAGFLVYHIPIIAGNYTISSNIVDGAAIYVEIKNSSGKYLYYTNNSFTLDETEQDAKIYVNINKNAVFDNTKLYPMLTKGTTALPFEPYCGGIPSPNPNYPQEIKNVGGEIVGNLCNLPDIEETETNGIRMSCKNGVITLNGICEGNIDSTNVGIFYEMPIKAGDYVINGGANDTNKHLIVEIQKSDGSFLYKPTLFSLDGTEICCRVRLAIQIVGMSYDNVKLYPMVNKGTTPLPWRPYVGKVVDIAFGGKNLIPYPYLNTTKTINGVTFTDNGNGSVSVKGTATENIYYNLCRIHFSDKDYLVYGYPNTNTDGKVTISGERLNYSAENDLTYIYVKTGETVNFICYPMMEYGAVATEWEPYKQPQTLPIQTPSNLPGIPVDSNGNYVDENGQEWISDYIILSKNATGKNLFPGTESNLLSLSEFINKNIFNSIVYENTLILSRIDSSEYDSEDAHRQCYCSFGEVPYILANHIKPNKNYVFSCKTNFLNTYGEGFLNGKPGTMSVNVLLFADYTDKTYEFIFPLYDENRFVFNINTGQKQLERLSLRFDLNKSGIEAAFYDFQLEFGALSDFEPYMGNSSGKYVQHIMQETVDDSTDILCTKDYQSKLTIRAPLRILGDVASGKKGNRIRAKCNTNRLCNRLLSTHTGYWNSEFTGMSTLNNEMDFNIPYSYLDGVTAESSYIDVQNAFKEWAKDNPTEFHWAIDIPIITDLTEEQVQVFLETKTYYPTTTITNSDNANMEVGYKADATKN